MKRLATTESFDPETPTKSISCGTLSTAFWAMGLKICIKMAEDEDDIERDLYWRISFQKIQYFNVQPLQKSIKYTERQKIFNSTELSNNFEISD